ncbi:hypothetical protein ACFOEK_06260 [Litoribrevibacter euphylliae]|uniref:Lipoprotein n=1 Tax=Litoribrevibacter euphylliae TaxID=1834034 RepID=A0ABV7HET3_9GAMM
MKFLPYLLLLITLGCSSVYNYEEVSLYQDMTMYLVEVKGQRRLMAHDPISAIKGATYEETKHFKIPRSSGRIEGYEIEVPKGYYKYVGFIDIQTDRITIDLKYNDTDQGRQIDTGWSGEYKLVRK